MSEDDGRSPEIGSGGDVVVESDDGFERLIEFIADSRSIDFSGYKRSSLTRRVTKRMSDVGVEGYGDYRDLLETNGDEFRLLLDTVLINVTSFFRDPGAWEYLRAEVVPEIVERAGDEEIRVWSAGCSSGEEAFSLAITFAEEMGEGRFRDRVKIYATDIDEGALQQARHAEYPTRAVEGLSPDLLARYFESSGDHHRFRTDLRRRVIFGRHDITQDAPISRLHLLVCRNTLMYFNAETQSQIIDRFHYALGEGGVLFLGKAEMLLSDGGRFDAVSVPHRIFRRRPGIRMFRHAPPVVTLDAPPVPVSRRERELRDLALDVSPVAHLVIDVNGTVTMVNNQARAWFGISARDEGRPLRDLEISYRPVELRSLIDQAQADRRVVRLTSVERRLGPEDVQYLDLQVQPLISDDGVVLGIDVAFADTTALVRVQEEARRTGQDLETAYEELQSTNEELETTNEELQSSIEELETTNEELQSTNEELETTNEELQSSNEELETMNEELRSRTGDLDEVAEYLESILASVPTGLIVLDPRLVVRSWSAHAQELWGLRADEAVGEPFFALDFGLPTGVLRDLVRGCLVDGESDRADIEAVDRLGRSITCEIVVSPLGKHRGGVLLSMRRTDSA